ncbi:MULTISPECIES: hypothetical protein [Microbacterium]|uniref:hypothetical protein n=1 Tax=Microbacterium TaxID=33882 RepID=UPI00146C95E5|nr:MULTISPECIES: hypothetical protein [Microbacterium]
MDEKDRAESGPEAPAGPDAAHAPRRARRVLMIGVAAAAVLVATIAAGVLAGGGGGLSAQQTATPTPTALPTPGSDPGAAPADGSEVPDPLDSGAPEASGPGTAPAPETTPFPGGTLPASASASGELVDGFPEPLMTPMSASEVLNSEIATEGDVTQVTLVARTAASADKIREHYRTLWGDSGLQSVRPQDSGAAFADPSTSLTLGFAPESGTGTVYVLFGVFRSQ